MGHAEISVSSARLEEYRLHGGLFVQGYLKIAVDSILAKNFAEAGMVCRISETHANGWIDRFTNEFSLVKSVTILTFFPSSLTTKNAGEHHSVGVWHGVMMFLASSSLMQVSAGSQNRNGICRAAETR